MVGAFLALVTLLQWTTVLQLAAGFYFVVGWYHHFQEYEFWLLGLNRSTEVTPNRWGASDLTLLLLPYVAFLGVAYSPIQFEFFLLAETRRALMARLRVIAAVTVATTVALSIPVASASPEAMKALGILEMRQPTAAPDVTLRTLTGPTIAMKDLRGKAVLVNFWATWCTPCQWGMPLMENLYQTYKARGFVILAISIDQGNADGVRAFVKDRKLCWWALTATSGA